MIATGKVQNSFIKALLMLINFKEKVFVWKNETWQFKSDISPYIPPQKASAEDKEERVSIISDASMSEVQDALLKAHIHCKSTPVRDARGKLNVSFSSAKDAELFSSKMKRSSPGVVVNTTTSSRLEQSVTKKDIKCPLSRATPRSLDYPVPREKDDDDDDPLDRLIPSPQRKVESFSVLDLLTKLDDFSNVSGSSATSSWMRERAISKLPYGLLTVDGFLRNHLFNRSGNSLNQIVEDYSEDFEYWKGIVTHYPTAKGKEKEVIHSFIWDILQLLKNMLGAQLDQFEIKYEEHFQGLETAGKIRKVPDFSINNIPLINISQLPFTFLDCLVPIECSTPPLTESTGLLQSVHYLVERLRYQIEVLRPTTVNLHGFAVATNGLVLDIAFLEIKNNVPKLRRMNKSLQIFPGEKRHWNSVSLKDLPGLQALIGLLLLSKEELGYIDSSSTIDGFDLIEVLGIGSFSTTYYVKKGRSSYALKMTRFINTLTTSGEEFSNAHLQREIQILKIFKKKKVPSNFLLEATIRDNRCIFFSTVGMSLVNYFVVHGRKEPQKFVCKMMDDLLNAINDINNNLRVCHRDIRPPNILVDINANAVMVKLCDWGMAAKVDAKYNFVDKNLFFHHSNIIEGYLEYEGLRSEHDSIIYKSEYDVESVYLCAAAVLANTRLFDAPWVLDQIIDLEFKDQKAKQMRLMYQNYRSCK